MHVVSFGGRLLVMMAVSHNSGHYDDVSVLIFHDDAETAAIELIRKLPNKAPSVCWSWERHTLKRMYGRVAF